MKVKKISKLFIKYMLNMFAIILISLSLMSILFLAIETSRWNNDQSETLSTNTKVVADNVQNLIHSFHDDTLTNAVPIYIMSNTVDTLCAANNCDIFISDMNGKVILCREMVNNRASSKNNCPVHSSYKISKNILKKAAQNNYSEITTLDGIFPVNKLVVATPILSGTNVIGVVFATKAVVSTWSSYVSQIAKIMLFSAAIALIVSAIIIYGMVYKITKPLRQMSHATKMYAQGDFSYKVIVKGDDEMADLARAFNNMASSLSVLESSRRSFVANVSHELKTPMTTIGGFIDGILDGTIDGSQEKRYLAIVSDEVKRLSRLVTGMLNMSKLEAGEMHINSRDFDISQSIFRTLLNFEKKINSKSIEILGLDKMQSITVNADEDMLMQVIYNLVDNAIKFTPDGGYISINAFQDGDKVFVDIKNSGDGISPEELDKIFERFYKTDKSRSYDVKGAGLGLYIVKSIITLHGGEIKATSEQGSYTEFSFWIPLKQG